MFPKGYARFLLVHRTRRHCLHHYLYCRWEWLPCGRRTHSNGATIGRHSTVTTIWILNIPFHLTIILLCTLSITHSIHRQLQTSSNIWHPLCILYYIIFYLEWILHLIADRRKMESLIIIKISLQFIMWFTIYTNMIMELHKHIIFVK